MRSGFQAFLAGFAFPALIFMLLSAMLIPQGIFYFFRFYPLYFLPIIWGAWNVLYYYFGRHVFILKKLGVWGGILGFSTALLGIFRYSTLSFFQKYFYAELTLPNAIFLEVVIYFILWEVLVRYFNRILID